MCLGRQFPRRNICEEPLFILSRDSGRRFCVAAAAVLPLDRETLAGCAVAPQAHLAPDPAFTPARYAWDGAGEDPNQPRRVSGSSRATREGCRWSTRWRPSSAATPPSLLLDVRLGARHGEELAQSGEQPRTVPIVGVGVGRRPLVPVRGAQPVLRQPGPGPVCRPLRREPTALR